MKGRGPQSCRRRGPATATGPRGAESETAEGGPAGSRRAGLGTAFHTPRQETEGGPAVGVSGEAKWTGQSSEVQTRETGPGRRRRRGPCRSHKVHGQRADAGRAVHTECGWGRGSRAHGTDARRPSRMPGRPHRSGHETPPVVGEPGPPLKAAPRPPAAQDRSLHVEGPLNARETEPWLCGGRARLCGSRETLGRFPDGKMPPPVRDAPLVPWVADPGQRRKMH